MVRLQKSSQRMELATDAYTLSFDKERPWYIQVSTSAGLPVAELFVGSSVDTVHARDDLEACGPPFLSRDAEATVVTFRSRSSCWAEKRYVFACREHEVSYRVEVTGQGRLSRCHLWCGSLPEDATRLLLGENCFRPGFERPYRDLSRGSRAQFETYYSARPTAAERDLRMVWEDDEVDLNDDPTRNGGLDAFLPGLWAIAVELAPEQPWVAMGLAPEPHELEFQRFSYRGGVRFGFEIDYGGAVQVTDEWRSPALVITFGGRDVYGACRTQVAAVEARRGPVAEPGYVPSWWRRPVFDGTGHQARLARGGAIEVACTEAAYTDALARLEQAGLDPGVVWIGPGWWATAGALTAEAGRWPDLRGFVAAQHARRRRIILTWPLLDDRGALPEVVRQALSPDGLDADGLRLVWPASPSVTVAHLLTRLRELREAARSVKPEALMVAPVANPYFAGLVDQVTLGALWTDRRSVAAMLRHRLHLARLASPHWLLAVEHRHAPGREAWREAVELQSKLGVPVLAYADALDSGEALDSDDLRAVARSWVERL